MTKPAEKILKDIIKKNKLKNLSKIFTRTELHIKRIFETPERISFFYFDKLKDAKMIDDDEMATLSIYRIKNLRDSTDKHL